MDDCVSARFLFAENNELHGRDAGLYEGDMRLTIDQALMIESGEVRGSIKTGKWPDAELAYEIDPSLSKSFLTGEIDKITKKNLYAFQYKKSKFTFRGFICFRLLRFAVEGDGRYPECNARVGAENLRTL